MGHRAHRQPVLPLRDLHLLPLHLHLRPDHGRVPHLGRGGDAGAEPVRRRPGHRPHGAGAPVGVLRAPADLHCVVCAVSRVDCAVRGGEEHFYGAGGQVYQWPGWGGVLERRGRDRRRLLCEGRAAGADDGVYGESVLGAGGGADCGGVH